MKTERMAEPRERPRLKEGYPFPDINSYVVALKNRLHIPEERFQELRRTRGVKLEGWMSAVQPVEDDRPPVRARIGSKGFLLSSDIKLPGKITENTPVSQVLQTDALYLAKLKYLKEAAPQATSWGRGGTKEKQVKQQITELTSRSVVAGGKIDRISFGEALTSLDKKNLAPALVTATLALASCGGLKPIEPSPAEPVVTEVAQVPTASPEAISSFIPTPEPTPTPEGANILNLMEKAREAGLEVFSVQGPSGVEVVVDVAPQEVVEEGEWSWELRGFTREVEGQLQIWRTLKGRETDLSQWFDVVSSLEVPGYGTITIEFDREAMAKKGLTEIYLENPQDWKTVLDIFWEDGEEFSEIDEVQDYGQLYEEVNTGGQIPPEFYRHERLIKESGASFVFIPESEDSLGRGTISSDGEPGVAYKNTAQAGRPVMFMYQRYWVYDYEGWPNFPSGTKSIGAFGPANLEYFINRNTQFRINSMIIGGRNPWIYPGKNFSPKVERAYEAINARDKEHFYFSPLFGPRP